MNIQNYPVTSDKKFSFFSLDIAKIISFSLILIAFLLFLRDVEGVTISRWVFIGISTLLLVFCNKYEAYCFFAFLTPLFEGISGTYILSIGLVIILFKNRFSFRLDTVGFFCALCILLVELLSSFRGMFGIVEYFRFLSKFSLFALFLIDLDKNYNYLRMLKFYIFGYCAAIINILGQMLQQHSIYELVLMKTRFGNVKGNLNILDEGMRLSYNVNALGKISLLCIFTSYLLYLYTKKPVYIILSTLAFLIGFATQSRSFIITFSVGCILFAFFLTKNFKLLIINTVYFLLISVFLIGLIYFLIPNYVESLINRFQDSDLSNGRLDIMAYYFQEMLQYIDRFIMGVGLQNYVEKYGFFITTHNATQEVLIAWGILGLFAIILLLVSAIRLARKKNPYLQPIQYIPLFLILLTLQSGQGFSLGTPPFLFLVAYSVLLLPYKL